MRINENDIEKMVLRPAWKEVLLEMIASERLDPWNIDIAVLVNGFLKKIKEMKTIELHIPANIILAAAILLKYKSNVLRINEETQFEVTTEPEQNEGEEIPKLELISRIPPKGPITLENLMKEMERVMIYDAAGERPRIKTQEEIMIIPAIHFDIDKKMDEVFARVKKNADHEGLTTFSALLEYNTAEEIICTLLPLLHLSQKRMLDLKQDEFFGEISIKIN